jgi:hypothetical protein
VGITGIRKKLIPDPDPGIKKTPRIPDPEDFIKMKNSRDNPFKNHLTSTPRTGSRTWMKTAVLRLGSGSLGVTYYQCCGSMTFWGGSGYADPCL